jgi:hypothetical protein
MLVELEARTMPDESYRKCLASTRRLVELVTHPTKLLA